MFFFKKGQPEEKSGPGPLEAGPEAESQSTDQFPAEPSAEKLKADQAPASTGAKIDYSSEETLLALIEELVVAPAQKKPAREKTSPGGLSGLEQADTYARQAEASADGLKALAPPPGDEDLERLRQLVLGREIEALEKIHSRLSDPEKRTEDLSQIVTEAIRLRIRRDDELIGVLKTTVDNIVRSSVRQNPSELADNLFPVMGPAIRRSITESIRAMLQDFSRTVEKSFSLTGLKWRVEAIRSGMSFSEVVLIKTLEYQVEQVFLIHADSGQLLLSLIHHDAAEQAKDSEQVAAMFTVIQQFVNDSFSQGDLNTLEFGDRHIYVVRAPQAYLACVVRGQAPPSLRIDMQTTLELIVMDCAVELDGFTGDSGPFKKVLPHLEALLTSRFKDENQSLPFRALILPLAILLAITAPLAFLGYEYYQMNRMEQLVFENAEGPGLMPLRVSPHLFDQWEIICLKDDLAEDVAPKLAAVGLPVERFNLTYLPFISQDSEIVAKRLDRILADKPEGIEYKFDPASHDLLLTGSAPITWLLATYERLLTIPGLQSVDIREVRDPLNGVLAALDDEKVLRLSGRASVGWREAIRERAQTLNTLSGVDISRVEDDPNTLALKELVDKINKVVIFFPLGKDQPVPEDLPKLNLAVKDLVELEKLADSMGLAVSLIVYGHADPSGSQKHNYELSQSRAKTLAAMLYAQDSRIPISTYGMGADFAAEAGQGQDRASTDRLSRKIELKVHVNPKGGSLRLD